MVLRSSVLRGAIVALATLWLGSSLALAGRVPPHRNNNHPVQRPYRGEQKPKLDSVSIEGTITSEASSGILVAANGKGGSKSWTVVRGPMTRIHVTGTAKPEFLHAGLVVQFEAPLDTHNAGTEKIRQLRVVSPSPDNPQGIVPGTGLNSKVTGQLKAVHGSTLVLHAGTKTAEVELADEPTIDIAVADGTLASPGDKISVKGKAIHGKGICQADDVKITLALPLTGTPKKTLASHAEPKTHHRPEKADTPADAPADPAP